MFISANASNSLTCILVMWNPYENTVEFVLCLEISEGIFLRDICFDFCP